MVKRLISVLVLVMVLVNLAGCGALRKKFTRKKKKVKKPFYYQVEEYNIKPSIELYTKHYIYWRSWHREILEVLGESPKKDMRCIQEIIGNLEDMKENLIPEKQKGLEKHIEKIREIESVLKRKGRLSDAIKSRIFHMLEREVRGIKRDYTYRKMGPYIAPEFEKRIEVEEVDVEIEEDDLE